MDRGLLSSPRLLEASRKFVCARLVTYESPKEGVFLKSIGATRTGGVPNTTFVLLAPDGKTLLSDTGRAPRQAYPGTESETLVGLLRAMEKIAEKYPGNGDAPNAAAVPYLVDVRRALNVASCDDQPLLVVAIPDESKRAEVERTLTPWVWHPSYRGRFAFAFTSDRTELASVEGATETAAVLVIQPGPYGLKGRVIATAKRLDSNGMRALLDRGLERYEASRKGHRELRAGVRKGVKWEPESIDDRAPDPSHRKRRRRGA